MERRSRDAQLGVGPTCAALAWSVIAIRAMQIYGTSTGTAFARAEIARVKGQASYLVAFTLIQDSSRQERYAPRTFLAMRSDTERSSRESLPMNVRASMPGPTWAPEKG
jgi:hypothetical protein